MTTAQEPGNGQAIATLASPPGVQLLQLITGAMVSRALAVTARLGVADALTDGPRMSEITRTVEPTAPRCCATCQLSLGPSGEGTS